MKFHIRIDISLPNDKGKSLVEIDMPIVPKEEASLSVISTDLSGRWGKIALKYWLMPGLCIVLEDLVSYIDIGPELRINGPHVSMVCYGDTPEWKVKESVSCMPHLVGTMEIRNAHVTSVPTIALANNKIKRLSIIFSTPYLLKLLQGESWIKQHDLYKLLDLSDITNEHFHQYFLELPARHILASLLNEHFEPLQKRYYFELKLKELFFLLHLQQEVSNLEVAVPEDIRQKLIAAKAYLLANYHRAPTIAQLSRIVALNEFKLKHYFKTFFGITIKAYVISLRMEEARLLLQDNHPVNEVAARLGYKNVSHFILIFKRTFGETPRQITLENRL